MTDSFNDRHPALSRFQRDPEATHRYPDLRDHIRNLADAGLLVVVDEPVNKDTVMHPLVRWQYRGGIPEVDRRAFLFTRPTDGKGKAYDGAVLVAGLAGSRDIYRIGFGADPGAIGSIWLKALNAPIPPSLVERAPCHDIVLIGDDLDRPGFGLDSLPVPISTPGWDNAPYLTAGHYITMDPDTGIQNLGNYRGQIKGPRQLGMNPSVEIRPGILVHWEKRKARGERLPCAVIVGCPPAVSYTAVQKMPESLDELWVAGGLTGSAIEVVRAKTVDLLVPAQAEIVIEGYIETAFLEPEAPFGESHGYVNLQEYNAFMEVTAITRRQHPILTSFISQVTPSQSSVIRRAAMEPVMLNHLRSAMGISGVRRVHMHEPLTSVIALIAIQFAKGTLETEIWRALYGASSMHRYAGKWIIAVDEDIDPENADALFWAMCYRSQPQNDLKVLDKKDPGHGPRSSLQSGDSGSVLINATMRGSFPPIALPRREFMEEAQQLWNRLGLQTLKPESPWYGYDLGHWPKWLAEQAALATRGEYFATGEKIARQRRSDVAMNTPILQDPAA